MLRTVFIFKSLKRITANIALLVLLMVANSNVYSQSSDTAQLNMYADLYSKRYQKSELVLGINWQGNWNDEIKSLRYLEIGYAKSIHQSGRHGPISAGLYASEEVYFGDRNIYGTKIGAYTHYLFDIGLSMIYYTDFKKGNFKVRPEFGFGIGALRMVLGYNIPTINNKAFPELRKNNAQVTIQFFLPVKKKLINNNEPIFKSLLNKKKNGGSKNNLG